MFSLWGLNDPTRKKKRLRRLGVLAGVLLVATLIIGSSPLFQENFGVVDPGRVFRSAQPDAEFEQRVAQRGFQSVLNLRGGSPADSWYEHEARITKGAGVDFYDFPMSATRRPSRRELLVLIDLFQRCRYPLLIHCKSGSDRTGLASALYLMMKKETPPKEAERALSLYYWHIRIGGAARLHDPLVEYAQWLDERSLAHSANRFRLWVEHDYRDPNPSTTIRALRPGPREQVVARAKRRLSVPLSR